MNRIFRKRLEEINKLEKLLDNYGYFYEVYINEKYKILKDITPETEMQSFRRIKLHEVTEIHELCQLDEDVSKLLGAYLDKYHHKYDDIPYVYSTHKYGIDDNKFVEYYEDDCSMDFELVKNDGTYTVKKNHPSIFGDKYVLRLLDILEK